MRLIRRLVFTALCLGLVLVTPTLEAGSPSWECPGRWQRLEHTGWLKENERALAKLSARRGKGTSGEAPMIAAFDWDNTMILNDVGEATLLYLIDTRGFSFNKDFWGLIQEPFRTRLRRLHAAIEQKGESAAVSRPSAKNAGERLPAAYNPDFLTYRHLFWLAYKDRCERYGDGDCYGWTAQLLAGLSPEDVRKAAREAIARETPRPIVPEALFSPDGGEPVFVERGLCYYPEMTRLTEDLAGRGFEIWIVSASPQWVVEEAASLIGIPPGRVLGILPELGTNGKILPRIKRLTYREGKSDAIREAIGRQPDFVAGDSNTDFEMLEMGTGPRLVIDRGKKPLMDIAAREGWLVQPRFWRPSSQ